MTLSIPVVHYMNFFCTKWTILCCLTVVSFLLTHAASILKTLMPLTPLAPWRFCFIVSSGSKATYGGNLFFNLLSISGCFFRQLLSDLSLQKRRPKSICYCYFRPYCLDFWHIPLRLLGIVTLSQFQFFGLLQTLLTLIRYVRNSWVKENAGP